MKKDKKYATWVYRFNNDVEVTDEGIMYQSNWYPFDTKELASQVICKSCRIHKIAKGNGKFRYVYAPNTKYKKILQLRLPELEKELTKLDVRQMFHAFRSNFNVVTNAKAHIGYKYSAKFDLQSFFDTVTEEHVPEYLRDDLLFIKGVTRQGLPTSPTLASIALLPHAYKIEDRLKEKFDVRMTVYADDITISFNNRMEFEGIKQVVYDVIKEAGFKINYKKTKLKFGHKNGMRRIICGVAVDDKKIYRTRETKRKIRLAIHQERREAAVGLLEWARCRPPRRFKG